MPSIVPPMSSREPVIGLAEIAENAKVAVSTVSRALRNSPEIHPATRKHILKEARALGYEPSKRARNKEAAQPLQILVLTAGNEPPRGYMNGLSQAAIKHNVALHFHTCPATEAHTLFQPEKIPVALKQGLAGGVILIFRWPTEIVKRISQQLLTTSIVHAYPGVPIDTVAIQDTAGMTALIEHLRELGHRQIGFFGLNRELSWSRARYAAFIDALVGADLPLLPEATFYLPRRKDNGRLEPLEEESVDAVAKQIQQGIKAWIVPDEGVAYALGAGLQSRGFRIPGDVSITGFHRHPEHPLNVPVMTTISVNVEEIAELAIKRLLARREEPTINPLTMLLPCELTIGESTGPLPV